MLRGPAGDGDRPGVLTNMDRALIRLNRVEKGMENMDVGKVKAMLEGYRKAKDVFWRIVIGLSCAVGGAVASTYF
jgi:hypothetical protein